MENVELIELAKKARENAKPFYSKFKVGAALLCKSGNIYLGSNIEDKSYLITGVCAERLAIYKALEVGETEFEKIAVVGGMDKLVQTTPCGICRQTICMNSEINTQIIYLNNNGEICTTTISDLLPMRFNEKFDN